MNLKKLKLSLGVVGAASIFLLGNYQTSAAATTNNSFVTQTNTELTNTEIQTIDSYITVSQNQYVLTSEGKKVLSEEQIQQAESLITASNKNISNNRLIIDPETKEAIEYNPFMSFAAYNKHYTYAWEWFGGRYYFTSNAAVEELAYKFRSHANNLALVGVVGGPASTILAGAGAWKYNQIANDLEYYNSTHSHNQIYMDLNWNMSYSFHILQ